MLKDDAKTRSYRLLAFYLPRFAKRGRKHFAFAAFKQLAWPKCRAAPSTSTMLAFLASRRAVYQGCIEAFIFVQYFMLPGGFLLYR